MCCSMFKLVGRTIGPAQYMNKGIYVSSMCLYICIDVCMYLCIYIYIYICLSVCLSVCLYVYRSGCR